MIIYFSATGNCQYVAEKIADSINDTAVSITELIQKNQYELRDTIIGIVSPTYFWGLPSIVEEYLCKTTIITDYLYFIATYGTTPGSTHQFAETALHKKLDASYAIQMPDNWTVMFDLSTPEKVAKFTQKTEQQLSTAIEGIQTRKTGLRMDGSVPKAISAIAHAFYGNARNTSHFSADCTCIGCGLCAKGCPVQAIEMRSKKPVWVKDQCAICLKCLHRCPKFAIQYDNKTRNHGQYVHPGYHPKEKQK